MAKPTAPASRIKTIAANLIILLIVGWLAQAATAEPARATKRKPLLISGKKSLYQRVITHPGAKLHPTPAAPVKMMREVILPFTVFYVYDRAVKDKKEWVEVGLSTDGRVEGWLEYDKTSDWRQSLTLMFTERTGRRPVLFFKDMDSLEEVAASAPPGKDAPRLAEEFKEINEGKRNPPKDFPVTAMEPANEALASDRFYLMPIFDAQEPYEGVKFLEVGSIDPGSTNLPEAPIPDGAAEDQAAGKVLRTGITFVIDTSISMRPYINRTREAVQRIYDAVAKAGLAKDVAFGLVAFRSSVEKTPGLEYASKVISDLKDGGHRAQFEKALDGVSEATVSSHSFNEEAFAGLKTAIEKLSWKPYHSRMIMLITDAGAIRNDDPLSVTGMNEREIADLARAKNIKIFALHLKTPAGVAKGRDNHAFAERQYKVLTGQSDVGLGDLYVPIEADEEATGVAGFGYAVEAIAGQMVNLVKTTAEGKRLALPAKTTAPPKTAAEEAERKAAIVGYAMQLEFLGRQKGVRAPKVVTSWVSDMDLVRPDTPAFQVAVLLTKNQLSDLYQQLRMILSNAQRTKRTGARDFFQSIISAAAQASRDPLQMSKSGYRNLGQLGVLGEFLDDLPYRSNVMRLTEEDWYRQSVGEQQAFIDDLKSKLRRYREYHNDTANWVSFGDVYPGDAYYRVPLSMLP